MNAEVPKPDVTFSRKDPQTYVVLIARAGPEGVLIGTRHFKPTGTEYATELDLFEAGYVRWATAASFLGRCDRKQAEACLAALRLCGPDETSAVRERIARSFEEELSRLRGRATGSVAVPREMGQEAGK